MKQKHKFAKTQAELARACGIDHSAISRHTRSHGFPVKTSQGWDIALVKAWLEERRQLDKANPKGSYAEESILKIAAQRALLELELELKRGDVIQKDIVEMQQRQFVQTVQNGLTTCHTSLAMLVAGKSQAECETEIKAFMRRMIESWKKLAKKGNDE